MYKTIKDIDLNQKRIFLRVDFNVPIQDGMITSDYKIRRTIPTIQYLLDKNVKSILIASHLNRPKGLVDPTCSLQPIHELLEKYFESKNIKLAFKNFYDQVSDYTLFENLRFLDEEESLESPDVVKFTEYIKENCDVTVFDAFGVIHRECASLLCTGLPIYCGLLVEEELMMASELLHPKEKFDLIILGGKKVSDKAKFLVNCVKQTKKIFLVGCVCFTFMIEQDTKIGSSYFEDGNCTTVEQTYEEGDKHATEIITPVDFLIQDGSSYYPLNQIDRGTIGVDIGPSAIKRLEHIIKGSTRIFWNGPAGKIEDERCVNGTNKIVELLEEVEKRDGLVIIGGGDTVKAVENAVGPNKFRNMSTGGGALLALLDGKEFPIFKLLQNK